MLVIFSSNILLARSHAELIYEHDRISILPHLELHLLLYSHISPLFVFKLIENLNNFY